MNVGLTAKTASGHDVVVVAGHPMIGGAARGREDRAARNAQGPGGAVRGKGRFLTDRQSLFAWGSAGVKSKLKD